MKRTPLHRRTPIRQRRATPRNRKTVVRLRGQALADLRRNCFVRDLGRCVDCREWTHYAAEFDGDPLAFDMAHIKSRGACGSDTLDNVVTKCHRCHMDEHAGHKQEIR